MPADGPFTDEDIAALKQKFTEGESGQVFVLEHDEGVTFLTPPEPVLFLPVPAEDVCGVEPDLEWRAGTLRTGWPEAVGVSQCALAPEHLTPHVGVLFVRTGGVDRTCTYATQVPFPREVDGG